MPTYWYSNKLGFFYEVEIDELDLEKDYIVLDGNRNKWIDKSDATHIENEK